MPSVSKRVQNAKENRTKKKEEYVFKELQDQNLYLHEKLQFLKVHQTRNENEISRLSNKNLELKAIKDELKEHTQRLLGGFQEWDQFRKDIAQQEDIWREKVLHLDVQAQSKIESGVE